MASKTTVKTRYLKVSPSQTIDEDPSRLLLQWQVKLQSKLDTSKSVHHKLLISQSKFSGSR